MRFVHRGMRSRFSQRLFVAKISVAKISVVDMVVEIDFVIQLD